MSTKNNKHRQVDQKTELFDDLQATEAQTPEELLTKIGGVARGSEPTWQQQVKKDENAANIAAGEKNFQLAAKDFEAAAVLEAQNNHSDPGHAAIDYEHAGSMYDQVGDFDQAGHAYSHAGTELSYASQPDLQRETADFNQAAQNLSLAGHYQQSAQENVIAASLDTATGHYQQAAQEYQLAANTYDTHGYQNQAAQTEMLEGKSFTNAAEAAHNSQSEALYDSAATAYMQAGKDFSDVADVVDSGKAELKAGDAFKHAGDISDAITRYEKAESLFSTAAQSADAAHAATDYQLEGTAYQKEGIADLDTPGHSWQQAAGNFEQAGTYLAKAGDNADAIDAYRNAKAAYTNVGDASQVEKIEVAEAGVYEAMGQAAGKSAAGAQDYRSAGENLDAAAQYLNQQGHYNKDISLLNQAAGDYDTAGDAAKNSGDFRQAVEDYGLSASDYNAGNRSSHADAEELKQAEAYGSLGQFEEGKNNYAAAAHDYLNAVAEFNTLLVEPYSDTAIPDTLSDYKNAASAFAELGSSSVSYNGQKMSGYEAAGQVAAEAGADPYNDAATNAGLYETAAGYFESAGDTKNAAKAYSKAAGVWESLGNDTTGHTGNTAGTEWDDAYNDFDKAAALYENIADWKDAGNARMNEAGVYSNQTTDNSAWDKNSGNPTYDKDAKTAFLQAAQDYTNADDKNDAGTASKDASEVGPTD